MDHVIWDFIYIWRTTLDHVVRDLAFIDKKQG